MGDRYDPWEHSASLGLRVIRRRLPEPLRACWHMPSRTVLLDQSLSQRERRCSLAHEIVHVERGDECRQSDRVEAEVHLVAARRLITIEHLTCALSWTRDPRVLADELWVDDITLEVRLDALTLDEREWVERVVVA